MKERRTVILMALLLMLLGVFVLKPAIDIPHPEPATIYPPSEPLLPGENEIRSVDIAREADGNLYATIRYYFRGGVKEPRMRVVAESSSPEAAMYFAPNQLVPIEKGEHTVKVEITRPFYPEAAFTSKKVVVSIYNGYNGLAGSTTVKEVDYTIAWITLMKYQSDRRLASSSSDELYQEAVELIDRGENSITLGHAQLNLERLLLKDPDYVAAYAELARVAMKTNWNAEGLGQAESYLKLGLARQPQHANSHVLLGYVYTHQERYPEALHEYEVAQQAGTDNLWLWSNWGEYYKRQGQLEAAVAMYLKAVDGVRPYNSSDRARLDAYSNLITLLKEKDSLAKLEPLLIKRAEEFTDQPCLRAEYAAFRIYGYQDYEGALAQSRQAMSNGCNTPRVRNVMGIANYLGWIMANDEQSTAYLSEAQLLYPASPQLLYQLATDEHTASVLSELNKLSISIELKDKDKLNALSYALMQNNVDAARRLIEHGANLHEIVGEQQYPVAMTPIFYQHVEGVQLLIDQGVNWSSVTFRGETAAQYAEKTQNNDIIRLLKKVKT